MTGFRRHDEADPAMAHTLRHGPAPRAPERTAELAGAGNAALQRLLTGRLHGLPANSRGEPLSELAGAGNAAMRRLLTGNLHSMPVSAVGPLLRPPSVQRARITKRGTSVHDGAVGAPPAGFQGPPVGGVQVRTGEDIELAPGSKIPNTIALEYSGALSANSRWLQFVWFELTAATPKGTARLSGSVPTTSGTKPFTTAPATPNWSVDSGSTTNPFYEAAGAAVRNSSSTTMFDAPGGAGVGPYADAVFATGIGATSVTFTAHFDTYLIQNDRAAYRVAYSASTGFTPGKGGAGAVASAIGYSVVAAGPVSSVPSGLLKLMHAAYPAFSRVR